jgi:hypothetical protein
MNLTEFAENKLGLVDSAVITAIDRRGAGEDFERHDYKVQFNPSELTIDASLPVTLSGNMQKDAQGSSDPNRSIPIVTGSPKMMFTTRLIFDEVNVPDAFASGKIPSSAAGIAKGIGTAAKKATLGGTVADWTVQPIVEGFIGALRNANTRFVRFNWGEFEFTGILEHVNAEYVMFSPSGNPIRAFVTLRLAGDLDQDLEKWIKYIGYIGYNILNHNENPIEAFNARQNSVGNVLNISW